MKLKLLTAAAVVAMATGANAQVVVTLDTLTLQDMGSKFTSVADNIADINGAVNITVGGQNGSSSAGNLDVGLTVGVSAAALGPVLGLGADLGLTLGAAVSETQEATTAKVGNIATTAAGAINSTKTNLEETAATASSAADAASSNTHAAASDMQARGAGIGVMASALNSGGINGSIVANVAAGNTAFGNLSTTAAGAINTSEISAKFVAKVVTP